MISFAINFFKTKQSKKKIILTENKNIFIIHPSLLFPDPSFLLASG